MPGFLFLLCILGCIDSYVETIFTGFTMGTTYSIKVVNTGEIDSAQIHVDIEKELENINNQMSTYISTSEISLFNSLQTRDEFVVSSDFYYVIRKSLYWSNLTNGAFDITVLPLTEAWGFGPTNKQIIPSRKELESAAINVGFNNINILDSNKIGKINPNTKLDVNAIAKGFAVDKIAELIRSKGYSNYMVEIGGEVVCSGKTLRNELWSIGIQSPLSETTNLVGYVTMKDQAMATSGDYRNYYIEDSVKVSHIINPQTGRTVSTTLTSVSVVSTLCIDADALATALLVLGVDSGMSLIESIPGTEALFIIEENEKIKTIYSSGFTYHPVF